MVDNLSERKEMRKELGKISGVSFGWGGYQDACLGLSLSFSMKGSGVNTFIGDWGIEHSEYCKWSEEDRVRKLGPLSGNGCDETAQRNGLVLAANAIRAMMDEREREGR